MLELQETQVNKQQLAAAFSRAANSYDQVAHLQQAVGNRLLGLGNSSLNPNFEVNNWLDLGCGTGYFCQELANQWPVAKGIGLDLAEGMLRVSQARKLKVSYLCADAEQLPLAKASQDLVFSSLALQWCGNFSAVLAEVTRILKPGGVLLFTSVAEGSLVELNLSWQAVDTARHVNQFRSFSQYQSLINACDLQVINLHCHKHLYFYNQVSELTNELKQLGADSIQTGRAAGLISRQGYQRLLAGYESFRQPQGLPASWQIVYGILRKI